MSISTHRLSQSAIDSLTELIPQLPAVGYSGPLIAAGQRGTLVASFLHPVYFLGLPAISGRRGLAAATPTGWRALLLDDTALVAMAELASDEQGHASRCTGFNYGPFVEQTRAAAEFADELMAHESQQFEIRALCVPGVLVWALWLKPAAGDGDLIIPMYPCNQAVAPPAPPPGSLAGVAQPLPYHALPSARFLADLEAEATKGLQSIKAGTTP